MGKSRQKIFNRIKSKVQNAKDNNLQARPTNKLINFIRSNQLIRDIGHRQLTYEEALKRIAIIRRDIDTITILSQKRLNPNQVEVVNILFMVDEIFTGQINWFKESDKGDLEVFKEKSNMQRQESDKQPDSTNMPDLESEESAAQEEQSGQGLKILTPDQMLSRLPISLAQLKAGNNSEKLENEIRQLLYSLYRSKTLTKNIYKSLVDISIKLCLNMEIFMNTENSITNESNKFI